ncbi:MAG: hypothetical protein ACK5D5_08385, partial [Bacteroidota bacterium]
MVIKILNKIFVKISRDNLFSIFPAYILYFFILYLKPHFLKCQLNNNEDFIKKIPDSTYYKFKKNIIVKAKYPEQE